MDYIQVMGQNGQPALLRKASITKIVDYGTYRTIYQGSDQNAYKMRESLNDLLAKLR